MKKYAFWNNKGGTGKTSLAFQAMTMYAEENSNTKILAVDLCPQANFSELLLGGLLGKGSVNLLALQKESPRKTIGGYFQERLPSPYSIPDVLDTADFISVPNRYNDQIPENIDLLAGDALVELQANSISTLANTQIPGTNTWLRVIDWLNDFLENLSNQYDCLFVDANPSFSIYTQIALAATDLVVLPVMADDSSRRAVQNALALVQGIDLPSEIYQKFNFASRLLEEERQPPKFHLLPKNRLTQYMGPASAYHSVLTSIDKIIEVVLKKNPDVFSFTSVSGGVVNIRDFQTTGVVAFAKGLPFTQLQAGSYPMPGRDKPVQISAEYLENCIEAMNTLVQKL